MPICLSTWRFRHIVHRAAVLAVCFAAGRASTASAQSEQPALPTEPSAAAAETAPMLNLPAPLGEPAVRQAFLALIVENKSFERTAIDFVLNRANSDSDGFIDESLAVLVPTYKRALDAYADDNMELAADLFLKETSSTDPFIAVNAAYFYAQAVLANDDFKSAEPVLRNAITNHAPASGYTAHAAELVFLLGYSQVNLLDYEAATHTLQFFADNYTDAPERFRMSARQMLTELAQRQPKRLGDVQDLMNYAHRELSNGKTDDDVKSKQDEAVNLLDQLIEEAENKEKNQGKGGKGGKGGGRDPNNAPQNHAPRSELRNGSELREPLNGGRTSEPGEAWGKMPPREREEILQSLQKQFPSQYRDLVEQYYRQLAKDKSTP